MIPQELVDAIVNEIDAGDNESLKTCSLAGSPLRDSSQAHSAQLSDAEMRHHRPRLPRGMRDAHRVPRIAGYMTRLNMLLPSYSFKDLTAVENFRHMLDMLHNSLNVRPDLLFLLVSRVPTLTLDGVRVTEDADTDAVCGLLSRPDWAACSTNLTGLVVPLERHVNALLLTAAFSLEHLRFHCNGPMPQRTLPMPPFPLLRSIGFTLAFTVVASSLAIGRHGIHPGTERIP
ncbi:hypothetical protein B0H14DRAFT_3455342 [Mycena olivaceomarginata]|nr:hypothetical protein B0H14DRAFT_3455342 [Mycena olivaceomarginata]